MFYANKVFQQARNFQKPPPHRQLHLLSGRPEMENHWAKSHTKKRKFAYIAVFFSHYFTGRPYIKINKKPSSRLCRILTELPPLIMWPLICRANGVTSPAMWRIN